MSSINRSEFLKLLAGGGFGMFFFSSCKNILQEQPYSQIAPGNLLTSQDGVTAVLASAYGNANAISKYFVNDLSEWCTDLSWQTNGGENREAVLYINFNWDPSAGGLNNYYNNYYGAIRDANTILDNKDQMSKIANADELIAEARFVRALSYQYLHLMFGPTPLRKSNNDKLDLPKASESDMLSFIESEYKAVISTLPDPGKEAAYGRATSGAARGLLCKFYLNTKQWQKAADMAKEIINMGYYNLFPNFMDMLKVSNEGNREMIWVFPYSAKGHGGQEANLIANGTFPPGFQKWPRTGLVMQSNWNNWASQYRLRDAFYNSFDPNDDRIKPIMTEYINAKGNTINLLNTKDDTRSFRYWPDPNAQGNFHGNDIPAVRYADILLTRAEALNELNGPNQESIDLINQVRTRAGMSNLQLSGFSSKDALRSHILLERGWEFYDEGKRREDLIRMGKFIEYAHNRGVSHADSHQVLYPIPQPAIDANPNLKQNPGY
ncbi:MAG TPA: RagB/SusD family nutrient uptake outer membrane protein [Balneolales bacterium]|nr:RagB/SusD family nutrient uptake outer membrane protein [Balneolales bacterium]